MPKVERDLSAAAAMHVCYACNVIVNAESGFSKIHAQKTISEPAEPQKSATIDIELFKMDLATIDIELFKMDLPVPYCFLFWLAKVQCSRI